MTKNPVRRGLRAAATTTLALALGVGLAPSSWAGTDDATDATSAAGKTVRVATATEARRVTTSRGWARPLLADEGMAADGNDLIHVVRGGTRMRGDARRLREGDRVRKVDVTRSRQAVDRRIRRGVTTRAVTTLRPGQRRVVRPGRPGLRRTVVVRTRHDGRVVDVRRSTRTVRKPVDRRVLVGRRFGSVPGADRLNWRALARCESTNNPRAVNPAGYYGLYQFNRATWAGVGGSGLPSRASAAEQTYRAKLLYKARGRSPWPHCGRLL